MRTKITSVKNVVFRSLLLTSPRTSVGQLLMEASVWPFVSPATSAVGLSTLRILLMRARMRVMMTRIRHTKNAAALLGAHKPAYRQSD